VGCKGKLGQFIPWLGIGRGAGRTNENVRHSGGWNRMGGRVWRGEVQRRVSGSGVGEFGSFLFEYV
jgi:hypothetical protein